MPFKAALLSLWESVRASYWFVPSTMSIAAIVLSVVIVWVDGAISEAWLEKVPWLYSGTPSGARTLLATIANSMIGLAGVVFSITIVALTLASGQFGARLLRNFMRDKGNQITLGTFLAAFLYCLLILRQIQDSNADGGQSFVPQLGMLVAVLMALAGLGVLIFFIHHTAASIQAPNVIAAVSLELHHAIDTLYPEKLGTRPELADMSPAAARSQMPSRFEEDSVEIRAGRQGYVQRIQPEQLMSATQTYDLVVRMEHRPGQFVQRDDVVLRVWPAERVEASSLHGVLQETFAVGDQRSLAQDVEFAVEQLVEVAVRALSPGINDPFTAMQCVDRLGAALSELATRELPSPFRIDDQGRLRVLTYPKDFGDFLDVSYNQIRQYAKQSLDVLLQMLETFERMAPHVSRGNDREHLLEHVKMVYEAAMAVAEPERDRHKVERRHEKVQHALGVVETTA